MDQSYTDSDISLSPTKIFDRLQVLRQLQILQRGKLQKQCLQYQDSPETSSNLTEIVSQFSNSTNYNTFRSFLQSSCDSSNEVTPRKGVFLSPNLSIKLKEKDLVDGVKALNLSQESECIINSPLSSRSRGSGPSRNGHEDTPTRKTADNKQKQISLDEMPILSPKKDFETMVLEKLKNEKPPRPKSPKQDTELMMRNKKPFLKRGDGMTRFGLKKNDLVIQNTKSLPWLRKSLETRVVHTPKKVNKLDEVQIMVNETKKPQPTSKEDKPNMKIGKSKEIQDNKNKYLDPKQKDSHNDHSTSDKTTDTNDSNLHKKFPEPRIQMPKGKHPLRVEKGKTWAAVLSKEQSEFLRQLKQSDYYKNFASPAKSTFSDASCDEVMHKQQQEREIAEQNMFELLEYKMTNESFNLENSFINRFLKRSLECSGDSTPMNIQKCLADNPNLLHIFPDMHKKSTVPVSECSCDYTDYTDNCSVSSCSSCKTIEESHDVLTSNKNAQKDGKQKEQPNRPKRIEVEKKAKDTCQNQNDTVTETDVIKANMEEMNAKLVATSELLKDRLQELEDEIETFRKENSHLAKLREEIDSERQKFYEEKNAFEQKFNEEKILSEYYLAEEKEKLNKQKQTYERYVREMRGRLNKKDKDEVVSLKKEINDLKEEIRIKDAKSTSTIARLRNQLKIIEKDKNNLQEEVEKLKKENRRIQHSNEITRRLTNVKYLEEINKKLSHMSKNTHSEIDLDNDVKYKAYEIERQSRSRRVQPVVKGVSRQRAKSVPNLNVTSRYAKYFSQRDALSHGEKNETINNDQVERYTYTSDDDLDDNKQQSDDMELLGDNDDELLNEEENRLEKIYIERFQSTSPTTNRSQPPHTDQQKYNDNIDTFFMRKPNPNSRNSKSPRDDDSQGFTYRSKSPISILSNRSSGRKSPMKEPMVVNHSGDSFSSPKSPISTFDTRSYGTQKPPTVINQDQYRDKLLAVSPEPSTSNTNNVAKTSLNATEIKKSDGSRELRFPNGNVKYISADGKYSKFVYYNGDIKENFYKEGRIKYYYAEAKTFHTTHADGLEVLEFPDGQVEKRYKDGSSEIRLPNGSIRYHDPKNEHVREEWRFPDGTALTVSANGDQRIVFSNGQVEVHAKDHKRREFPDGTVKLVYTDGTSETRYASGRVRIKDKHGNLIMDSTPHEQK